MKMLGLFWIMTFLLSKIIYPQELTLFGQASIHNSKYNTGSIEYVGHAEVSADFSTVVATDDMGLFRLKFRGIATGTKIEVTINKVGLEVVNRHDIQNVILGRRDKLPVYLIEKGALATAQAEFYKVNIKSITNKYKEYIFRLKSDQATAIAELEEMFGRKISNYIEAEKILVVQDISS